MRLGKENDWPDAMVGPGLWTGPNIEGLEDRPGTGARLEVRLREENDGPDTWEDFADWPRPSWTGPGLFGPVKKCIEPAVASPEESEQEWARSRLRDWGSGPT